MLKSRKQKFVAPLMGLFVTDVVSVTKTRFAPWLNRILNPQLKEVYMVKRLLLLISSVLLAYGLGVAPVLAKEITLWSRDTNQAQLRALVDAWNETHETQIKLTLAGSDFESKLGLAMAAGAPPDIVPIEVTQFPKFSSEGHVLDITDQARALPYFDHLIKAHTAQATYPKVGGRVYGISFFPDTAVLVYNKDLFEQAGLDPENPPLSTRAEMKEAIERITALGDDIYGFYSSFLCNGCNMFSMLPQIWASGGDVLNEDSTAATFDDPEVAAFYEFYRELWTSGQLPPSAGADTGSGYITLFQAGKIGMQISNTASIGNLIRDHPELNFGVAHLPGREGGVSSFVGGDVISIPADSKHPDEAWEFIEWMSSEEVQLEYYAGFGMIPIRTDLYDPEKNPFFAEDPRLVMAAEASGFGRVPWSVNMTEMFFSDLGPWIVLTQRAILDGEYAEAVEELQKEATELLSETQ